MHTHTSISAGFAELEYGILRFMGACDDSTLVVTTVHDCQVSVRACVCVRVCMFMCSRTCCLCVHCA